MASVLVALSGGVDSSAIVGFAVDDLTIAVDDVIASGTFQSGINTFAFWGDTEIIADTVGASGEYAQGIRADSLAGDISIQVNDVDVEGFVADGIPVFADSPELGLDHGKGLVMRQQEVMRRLGRAQSAP